MKTITLEQVPSWALDITFQMTYLAKKNDHLFKIKKDEQLNYTYVNILFSENKNYWGEYWYELELNERGTCDLFYCIVSGRVHRGAFTNNEIKNFNGSIFALFSYLQFTDCFSFQEEINIELEKFKKEHRGLISASNLGLV